MAREAYMDRLYTMASWLINKRGYLVLGCWIDSYRVGQVVHDLWNVKVDQPLKIIGRTDKADWEEQCAMAQKEFLPQFKQLYIDGEDPKRSGSKSTVFYKAITD